LIGRTLTVRTERLQLREIEAGDWQAVLQYQRQPEYLRFYPWTERTKADVQQFVDMFVTWRYEHPRTKFQFAITLATSRQLIGLCGVRRTTLQSPEAELGYEIAPEFWKQGYATEAAEAMLAFAFNSLQVHRCWANCLTENRASIRVLEKLRMRREGHFRENRWMKNRWWDTYIYAILTGEWRSHHNTSPAA
jgi:RimJ/RimL family protein N-acetyltransferase